MKLMQSFRYIERYRFVIQTITIEKATEHVKGKLSPKRFTHTLGVVEMAKKLARTYHIDETQAHMAALLHDVMKESSLQEMQDIVKEGHIEVDQEMLNNGALLHGPAGAAYAKVRLHIEDVDICEAIRVHTLGSTSMSTLDKIIFLADYIEPNRNFPGVEELRQLAFIDLNRAVVSAYDGTIRHLLDLGLTIHADTIRGRNSVLLERSEL